ncbi:MAG TPA: hypothetical protein VK549_06420 [Acidimicrobiia bacterium]|nr:hypothetical protein [Acidimicrobiia bacterium]
MTAAPSRRATAVLYAALLLFAAVGVWHQGRRPGIDDAYIYFRYARNIADGSGWTYNPGRAGADAVTSPLYVLLLSIFARLGINLIRAGDALFIGGMTLCACATHALLARLRHWWAGAAAAVLVVASPTVGVTRGMETGLFLASIALALYLWISERDVGLGIGLAAVVLARPDGIIFVPVVLAAKWVMDRRPPVKTMLSGAAVAVTWLLFGALVADYLLPDTLAAKIAQGRSGFWLTDFFDGLRDLPKAYGRADGILMVIGLVGLVVVTLRAQSLRWPLGVLLGATVVQMAFYQALGLPPYRWYYVLPVYCASVFAGVALEWTALALLERWRPLVVLPVAALVAVVAVGFANIPHGVQPPRDEYEAAAEWINGHTPRHATVAATEIGILGYYTDRTVIDYLGLTDRSAIEPLGRGDLTWWVNHLAPDYWMTVGFPMEGPARNAPWFGTVFHEVYRNGYVAIYQRVGRAPV